LSLLHSGSPYYYKILFANKIRPSEMFVNTLLVAFWDGKGTSYPPCKDKVYDG